MILLTSYTAATYKSQIRSSPENGFKVLYNGSCTMGAEHAAQNLVTKYYGSAAGKTLSEINDPAEIRPHTGNWTSRTKPSQGFRFWTFNPSAR